MRRDRPWLNPSKSVRCPQACRPHRLDRGHPSIEDIKTGPADGCSTESVGASDGGLYLELPRTCRIVDGGDHGGFTRLDGGVQIQFGLRQSGIGRSGRAGNSIVLHHGGEIQICLVWQSSR